MFSGQFLPECLSQVSGTHLGQLPVRTYRLLSLSVLILFLFQSLGPVTPHAILLGFPWAAVGSQVSRFEDWDGSEEFCWGFGGQCLTEVCLVACVGLLCMTISMLKAWLRRVTNCQPSIALRASSLLSFLSPLSLQEQGVTLRPAHMSSGTRNAFPLLEGRLDKVLSSWDSCLSPHFM